MASIVLPAVGSALGLSGWALPILALAGSILDSYIFRTTTTVTSEQGKMSDIDLQTATLGAGIVKGYGTVKITGNLMWGTKFTEHITTETTTSGGGKGGGGSEVETTTTTYTYSCSFAALICEGPISEVTKIYADGEELSLSGLDYRIYYGTESQLPDDFIESIEGAGKVPAFRGMAYVVFRNMNLSNYGNRIPTLSFVVRFPKNTVKQILDDISSEAGLTLVQDVDTSDLANVTVHGFTRNGDQTYKEQIDSLRVCLLFDGVEQQGRIVFKRRSFDDVIALTASDYGAFENDPDENPMQTTVAHDISLPKKININYISTNNDYQNGVMSAYRQVTNSYNEVTMSTNVVMGDSEAKQVAELRLYEAWMARTKHEFKVSNKYGWILPGDVLEVAVKGGNKQLMLVTGTNYGVPGINVIKATDVASAVYRVQLREVDSNPSVIIPATSEVFYELLDIAKLPTDGNEGENYVYVVAGAESFRGVNIYASADGGVNYSLYKQVNDCGVIGVAKTVLREAKPYSWDNANSVEVELKCGSLESTTRENILNYANAAMLGNEIIQFTTAELISENRYRLSGLLRGRNGTEQHVSGHQVEERFVLLESSKVDRLAVARGLWYSGIPLKIGPRTKSVLDTEYYKSTTFTPQGIMSKPWSGCHMRVEHVGDTFTGRWIRRARKDGAWKDYADVPLNENSEAYEVDVLGNNDMVITTLYPTTTEFTYTGPGVRGFVVYQMSEARGRGWPLEYRL